MDQFPFIDEQRLVVLHDDLAVHHHRVDATAVGIVDQIVHRIEQGLPLDAPSVEQHQIGLLSRLQRADLAVQSQGLRPLDGRHLQGRLGGDGPGVLPRVFVQHRDQVHGAVGLQEIGVVAGIGAQAHGHAGVQHLGQQPRLGHAGAALDRRRGNHHRPGPRAGQHLHLAFVQTKHVRQGHVAAQNAQLLQVLGRPQARFSEAGIHVILAVVVVQREAGAVLVGQAFALGKQLIGAEIGCEGHGPGPDPAVQLPVEVSDGCFHGVDRVGGGGNRQIHRVGPVGHMGAHDDSAAGLPVGIQAPPEVLGAAGVHEGGGAVLQQLGDGQQAGVVLLILGHDRLELEHVGQVGRAQVVGEDAPGGVGVADVHVPVAEPRNQDHVPGVDHPVRLNPGQLRGLADLNDALSLDDQSSVANDAALGVHGDDETGAL